MNQVWHYKFAELNMQSEYWKGRERAKKKPALALSLIICIYELLDHLLTPNPLKKYMRSVLDHKYLCKISEARNIEFQCENLYSLCKHHCQLRAVKPKVQYFSVQWKNTITWRRIKHSVKNIKHEVQHITERCVHMLVLESLSKSILRKNATYYCQKLTVMPSTCQTTGYKGQICRI